MGTAIRPYAGLELGKRNSPSAGIWPNAGAELRGGLFVLFAKDDERGQNGAAYYDQNVFIHWFLLHLL